MDFLNGRLSILQDDITRLEVDAIVNAANETLLGGGGVDGAIHQAAGPQLLEECRGLDGALPGEAKMTGAYRLRAKYVIHTVGPRWKGGQRGEAETLAACYRNCLELARRQGLRQTAFPSISTGAFGYPMPLAARVAVGTIAACLSVAELPQSVILCAFSSLDRGELERAATELLSV